MQRVRREWANRVEAEYRSAAHTAEILHWLIASGVSPDTLAVGHRIVSDELAHAEQSRHVFLAAGGDEATIPIRQDTLTMGIDPNLVFQGRALVAVAQMFCAGETVAVPLFHAMRAGAEEPKVIACLDRIEKDEAVHRAFGWTTLDELLQIYGPVAHELVQQHVQRIVDGICAVYDSSDARLTDTQRAWGLLSGVDHRRISLACARDVIVPRFRQRGFEVDMPSSPGA
jgi:hypothetical protein